MVDDMREMYVADTHTLCPSSVDCSRYHPLDCSRCTCKSQLYCEWRFAAPGSDYLLSFRSPDCDTADCPANAKSNEAVLCLLRLPWINLWTWRSMQIIELNLRRNFAKCKFLTETFERINQNYLVAVKRIFLSFMIIKCNNIIYE